jgi:hypothetical protein
LIGGGGEERRDFSVKEMAEIRELASTEHAEERGVVKSFYGSKLEFEQMTLAVVISSVSIN